MFVRTRRRGSYPTTLAKSLKFIILLSGKLRGSANHAWQEGASSLRLQTVNCMPTLPTRSESCLPSRWFALIGELLFTFSRRPHVGTFTHLEFCVNAGMSPSQRKRETRTVILSEIPEVRTRCKVFPPGTAGRLRLYGCAALPMFLIIPGGCGRNSGEIGKRKCWRSDRRPGAAWQWFLIPRFLC